MGCDTRRLPGRLAPTCTRVREESLENLGRRDRRNSTIVPTQTAFYTRVYPRRFLRAQITPNQIARYPVVLAPLSSSVTGYYQIVIQNGAVRGVSAPIRFGKDTSLGWPSAQEGGCRNC